MDSSSEQAEPTNVPAQTSPTTVPQVRSRITVVCAECKRLKLKCNRQTPCGSCIKRDTLARCIYSPAAAEKVDLQSLNNRLMQVEATLAQLTSGQFVSSYPLSARPPPPSSSSISKPLPSSQQLAFVQAASGSAFTFPLEDVGSIWLDELNLGSSLTNSPSQADSSAINPKLEPDSIPISPVDSADAPKSLCQPLPSINTYYASSSSSSSLSQSPCLSPALLGLLPPSVSSQQSTITSPYTLQNLLHLAENSVAHTYPSLNWKHLRSRAMKMVAPLDNGAQEKHAKAMEIFFGQRQITPSAEVLTDLDSDSKENIPFFATISAALALGSSIADRSDSNVDPMSAEQNISRKGKTRKLTPSHSGESTASGASGHSSTPPSPLYWYSLSVQALSVYEGSTVARVTGGASTLDYDLDYLTACLLQVIFLLKGGYSVVAEERRDTHSSSQKRVEGIIFPLVGKMVNIARQIGLTVDPEENASSGTTAVQNTRKTKGKSPSSTVSHPNLFESEMRRRIWWDILYYDLFVSDAMGHPPLIPEKSFSTKLPVTDVDDKAFCPSSSRIPLPRIEDSMGYVKDGLQYFEVKCRMAQLVRNIKRRMASPEPILTQFGHHSHPPGTYSIEQAAFMESEIVAWLSQLPQCFKLDTVSSMTGSTTESILVAQRCEIAITTQRLIMKVYLPFLKKKGAAHSKPPYQAIVAVGNAAHVIIHASKMLHKLWDSLCTPRDPDSCFPAMFDFYPLPRILFDAAVISAYSVLKHPATWCASAAAEDADTAFDLLKHDEIWRGAGGLGLAGSFDIQQNDALRIVECLRVKLQNNGSPSSMSLKRKLDDIDQVAEDQMPDQSQLVQNILAMEVTESSSEERRRCPSPPIKESTRADSPPKVHEKKQAKRGPYPSVGVRVRPGREGSAPFSRPATRSKDSTFFASSPSRISSDTLYRHSHPADKEKSPLSDGAMSRSRSSSITQDPVQKLHPPQSPQLAAQAGYRVDQQNHPGYVVSPLVYEYNSTHHHQRTASSDYSDSISPYTPTNSNGPLSAADSPYTTTNVNTPIYGPSVSTNSEPFNPPHSYYVTPSYNYNNGHSNHRSTHGFEREIGQPEGDPMSFADTTQSVVYDATLAYQPVPLANTWPQSDYWHQSEYKHYS